MYHKEPPVYVIHILGNWWQWYAIN